LLKSLVEETDAPTLPDIHAASIDIFEARAAEAVMLGRPPRTWPPHLTAYPHWQASYQKVAESAGLTLTLEEAVAEVNAWLDEIDKAGNV